VHIIRNLFATVNSPKRSTRMSTRIELQSLLDEFEAHLLNTRGLNPVVCHNYTRYVRTYLVQAFGDVAVDVQAISASSLIAFVGSLIGRYRPSTIKVAVTSLRSFLRYLRMRGLRGDHLEDAVPGVQQRRQSGLPRYLEEDQLEKLLDSLDTSTPRALRDRAMILCVARLGLRAGDVVGLELDDIDWRNGILHVRRRKSGRGSLMPLPTDVGEAIVDYLRVRDASAATRRMFLLYGNLRAGEPATPQVVSEAVVAAVGRAGIDAPICGTHLLRHTLATKLLRRGSSLKEVADVMGHQSLESTRIYAKLDLASLREVAQPWPGEAP
jgi:site-specific recombinase XerD